MTQQERKRAAEVLNNNPLLNEILEKEQQKCFEAWQADPNLEDREKIWHRVKAIQLLRIDINAAVKSALREEQQQQPSE